MRVNPYRNLEEFAKDLLLPSLQTKQLSQGTGFEGTVAVEGIRNNFQEPITLEQLMSESPDSVMDLIERDKDEFESVISGNPFYTEIFFRHIEDAKKAGDNPIRLAFGNFTIGQSASIDLSAKVEEDVNPLGFDESEFLQTESIPPEDWNQETEIHPEQTVVKIPDDPDLVSQTQIPLRLLATIGTTDSPELKEGCIRWVRMLSTPYKAALARIAITELNETVDALFNATGISQKNVVKLVTNEAKRLKAELVEPGESNISFEKASEHSKDFVDYVYALTETIAYVSNPEDRRSILSGLASLLDIKQPMCFPTPGVEAVMEGLAASVGLSDNFGYPHLFTQGPDRLFTSFTALYSYLNSGEQKQLTDALLNRIDKSNVAYDEFRLNNGEAGVNFVAKKPKAAADELIELNSLSVLISILNRIAPQLHDDNLRQEIALNTMLTKHKLLLSGDENKISSSTYGFPFTLSASVKAADLKQSGISPKDITASLNDLTKGGRAGRIVHDIFDFAEGILESSKKDLDNPKWDWTQWKPRIQKSLIPFSHYVRTIADQRRLERGSVPNELLEIVNSSEIQYAVSKLGINIDLDESAKRLVNLLNRNLEKHKGTRIQPAITLGGPSSNQRIVNFDIQQELLALGLVESDNEMISQKLVAVFTQENKPDNVLVSLPAENNLFITKKGNYKLHRLHTRVSDVPKGARLTLLKFATAQELLVNSEKRKGST